MEKEIVLVDCDDWIGIYVNGKLKAENHSLSERETLKAIGIKFKSINLGEKEMEALGWGLPDTIEELNKGIEDGKK